MHPLYYRPKVYHQKDKKLEANGELNYPTYKNELIGRDTVNCVLFLTENFCRCQWNFIK